MGLKVEEIRAPDNKNVSYNKYREGGSHPLDWTTKAPAVLIRTRPNSWAKQVRKIERGHWILDFMIYEMKNGEGKV